MIPFHPSLQEMHPVNRKAEASYVALLKGCGRRMDLHRGSALHADMLKKGLAETSPHLANTLISMYARCGALESAEAVHGQICMPDIVSWNALISGYLCQGQSHEAMRCFERMGSREEPLLSANEITFACALKACSGIGAIDKGKQIHCEIARKGLLRGKVMLGGALVDMYAKCGVLAEAQEVHDDLPLRNVVSWSALISGYSQEERGYEALRCFELMTNEGISPNEITFVCVVKACASINDVERGEQIHGEIVARCLLEENLLLCTALVDMYAKCDALRKAHEVLHELHFRDTASWNALISGYSQGKESYEGVSCFERMKNEGLLPDVVTLTCVLKACGNVRAIDKGVKIHGIIVDSGLLENSTVLNTALMDMYVKCGMLCRARELHDRLCARSIGSWNTLIGGYVEHGQSHEALACFECMREESFSQDAITFLCVLKACGSTGSTEKGKEVHDKIMGSGLLDQHVTLGSGLVDMYAKCGFLTKAQHVHDELNVRTVISWSALIAGYAQQRQGKKALLCLQQMQSEGLSPNAVTFLCVLSACSRSGRSDEAKMVFEMMHGEYGFIPNLEHHVCMIIISGSGGDFEKAVSVIQSMPGLDHSAIWLSLLGACRKWGNLKLGKLAFDQAVRVDGSCGASYVLMADLYLDAGLRSDAVKIKA
jgi:pentatricopeptide repeat protein